MASGGSETFQDTRPRLSTALSSPSSTRPSRHHPLCISRQNSQRRSLQVLVFPSVWRHRSPPAHSPQHGLVTRHRHDHNFRLSCFSVNSAFASILHVFPDILCDIRHVVVLCFAWF
ncbi:unnamed protein product [Sphacelaria rigidula]